VSDLVRTYLKKISRLLKCYPSLDVVPVSEKFFLLLVTDLLCRTAVAQSRCLTQI